MYVVHATTTTSAPTLNLLSGGRSVELFGVIATYAESATFYVKFWYQGNTNATPVLGVTAPTLTVPISSSGPGFLVGGGNGCGVVMQGPVYWAATTNAADTDATALGAGGDVINILLG